MQSHAVSTCIETFTFRNYMGNFGRAKIEPRHPDLSLTVKFQLLPNV